MLLLWCLNPASDLHYATHKPSSRTLGVSALKGVEEGLEGGSVRQVVVTIRHNRTGE